MLKGGGAGVVELETGGRCVLVSDGEGKHHLDAHAQQSKALTHRGARQLGGVGALLGCGPATPYTSAYVSIRQQTPAYVFTL